MLAVDTMPEFEGPVVAASALMLEAKALVAKVEPFAAAVAYFHWCAWEKCEYEGSSSRAIDHLEWCVKLRPENADYWAVFIAELVDAKRFTEANDVSARALSQHPENAFVLWFAGWASAY